MELVWHSVTLVGASAFQHVYEYQQYVCVRYKRLYYFQGVQGPSGPPGAKGIEGEPVSLFFYMKYAVFVPNLGMNPIMKDLFYNNVLSLCFF